MGFAHPGYLALLLAWPALAWLVRRTGRSSSIAGIGRRSNSPRPRTIAAWLVAAFALLAIALAQPRWGRPPTRTAGASEDLVVVVDVSRSMGAEDVVPDRLGVAKILGADLIRTTAADAGSRSALVVFAGRGVLRSALTEHHGATIEALDSLRPGEVAPGGTDLAAALIAALDAFDDEAAAGGRTIVVFSDGEDHAGRLDEARERCRDAGVVVHAVGIGSDEGSLVLGDDGQPIRFEDQPVLSRRWDKALKELAELTGGAYLPLGRHAIDDFATLYRDQLRPIASETRRVGATDDLPERFAIFVAAGIAVILAGLWPGTRRSLAAGVAAALIVVAASGASADRPFAQLMARGLDAFRAGHFDVALASYEEAERAPGGPHPLAAYNAAACLYRLERFDAAMAAYERVHDGADPILTAKANYGLGNAALSLGSIEEAIAAYDRCLDSTAVGPDSDLLRSDAAINREFALRQRPPEPSDDAGDEPRSPAPKDDGPPPRDDDAAERPSPPGMSGTPIRKDRPDDRESPEEQLRKAIDRVEQARSGRLNDRTTRPNDPRIKDW